MILRNPLGWIHWMRVDGDILMSEVDIVVPFKSTWLLEPLDGVTFLFDILNVVAIRPKSGTLGRIHWMRGRQ